MKIITLILGRFAVNCYIVYNEGSSSCTVIDPGDRFEEIEATLNRNGLIPDSVILTHSHFDHIGAVEEIRNKYNCPIYVHKDEAEILSDGEKNLSTRFCRNPIEISNPENLIDEGDVITTAGLTFEVMHTPGHTKGCVIYRCGDTLFTGDTLFAGTCGRCDVWSSDEDKMRASLDRIFEIKENLAVLAGHGPETTLNRERLSYKYFI